MPGQFKGLSMLVDDVLKVVPHDKLKLGGAQNGLYCCLTGRNNSLQILRQSS